MRCLLMGLILCFVPLVAGQTKKEPDLTDGREILKRADAAAKTVKMVQYKASAKGIGADETRSPQVEGTAVFGGWVGMGPAKFRYDVKVRRADSAEPTEYSAGSDGDIVYLIDSAKKIVYADMDAAVLGSMARPVRSILVGKIVNPEGFSDELKDDKKVELKGTSKVGDQECYDVAVDYGEGNGDGVWSISKTDFLPRRVERGFPQPGGRKGGRLVTITDMVVNPKLDKDPFTLKVPEGFKKTDDFAP